MPTLARKLQTLIDVGLGYVRLGQSATTLSGGEAQRVKLSLELSKRDTGRTLYILDEPTTGLHFQDIKLLEVLHRLRDAGNTIVVIEHNMDVVKTADWVIDLGQRAASAAAASSPLALRKTSPGSAKAIPANTWAGLDIYERSFYFDRRMSPTKGEQTRAAILDEALKIASKLGLEGLTIGSLADATGMSVRLVRTFRLARGSTARGSGPRGSALWREGFRAGAEDRARVAAAARAFERWLDWTLESGLPGGCIMISAAIEYDDRPGPDPRRGDRQPASRQRHHARRPCASRSRKGTSPRHRSGADQLRDAWHRARRPQPSSPVGR